MWPKKDRNGDEYLIGDAQHVPALIDLRDATFIVFYPPEDAQDDEGGDEPKGPHATLLIRRDSRLSR